MVTAIYSLSHVHGAELWLLFWFICIIVYLGGCLAMKCNRTKSGIKTTLIGLLIAEVIIDLVWAIIYYYNGSYINYGIGAMYGIIMWIPVLILTSIVVICINRKVFER